MAFDVLGQIWPSTLKVKMEGKQWKEKVRGVIMASYELQQPQTVLLPFSLSAFCFPPFFLLFSNPLIQAA